jgi:hypothetical protein
MKKVVCCLLLLSSTAIFAQNAKSITNLIWSRTDDSKAGIMKFYIDSVTNAHVTYSSNDHTPHKVTLKFISEESNTYIFKGLDSAGCYWFFLSAIDTPTLKVTFQKTGLEKSNYNFREFSSWKIITGKNLKDLPDPIVVKDNLLESKVANFQNISCCTNHKISHCAKTLSEMAELSKKSGCVF